MQDPQAVLTGCVLLILSALIFMLAGTPPLPNLG